ncbi:MAG TPA: potassium transporter Kup [Caulobacteraceae bacterium]|jgi:KUP system potassium uptake protein|nr:potassium transporter Kup [Caulobacteraceae bacterium]
MTGEPHRAAPSSTAADPANPAKPAAHNSAHTRFWPMAVGAIGVVFGDIGTSPLYAFRQALQAASGDGGIHADAIFGVASLALWALFLVVTLKYVIFLMRADNKGEGGVLALMALAQSAIGRRTTLVFMLGVTGAALFYGDSIITPAISVLSAIEGLKTIPALQDTVSTGVVIAVSLVILGGLFAVQSRGTAKMAGFFGPILTFWFLCIAGVGLLHLVHQPGILLAISPTYAVGFLIHHGVTSFFVLGSVFLTVTGAEALYADMGHFGRWPIQAAWLFLALPCLVINYLGQGAFALEVLHRSGGRPVGDVDWFFQMIPALVRMPMVILATAATVIASQAVITGAYSMTQQAMQLGLLPRMILRRTSETAAGQIYLPQINMFLAVGVVLLIGVFKTSDNLGQAYGLAVTGTMVVTTSLAFIVVRRLWKWPLIGAFALIGPLWALDVTFLAANSLKIFSGAAMPLVLGGALFLVMATWVRGGDLLTAKVRRDTPELEEFLALLKARPPHRVTGTAVYLTADPDRAPGALLHNLKHNRVLHEHNVILTVETTDTPRVPDAERVRFEPINDDFKRVHVKYGFMETPNIPKALAMCRKEGLVFEVLSTSFFLGRKTVVANLRKGLGHWQDRLFILLAKNSANPTDFYQIPPGRVLEMGTQVSV